MEPEIDIADETYTAGAGADLAERRRWGRLIGHTSNTVGRHYLRLTMVEPRDRTEWSWGQHLILTKRKCTETHVGIRLNAKQVRQLRFFLDEWLDEHRQYKEALSEPPKAGSMNEHEVQSRLLADGARR